jgi:uroporphyrinogen-III synthase
MRIWVARPEPGATRTAARLSALGHRPLVAPVLDVAATGAALPDGVFAGLILTSANAVRALTPGDRARFRTVPVFAVGASTAAFATAAGFSEIRVAGGNAAALARLVTASVPPGAALLHATGTERKAEPGASLTAAGFGARTCEVYTARPAASLADAVADAMETGALDAVLHYSRRSASARSRADARGLSGAFRALTHYCLSADVAAPLVCAGIAVHFVPERPNEDALLAGLSGPGPTGI